MGPPPPPPVGPPPPSPRRGATKPRLVRRALVSALTMSSLVVGALGLAAWSGQDPCAHVEELIAAAPIEGDPERVDGTQLSNFVYWDAPEGFPQMSVDSGPLTSDTILRDRGSLGLGRKALEDHGFYMGWNRIRYNMDISYEVSVHQFQSAGQARSFHLEAARWECTSAVEAYEVDWLPGAAGLRIQGTASELLGEEISFVRGSRRYVVGAWGAGDEIDRDNLMEVLRLVDEVAR
jgi:hypothetical protein